MRAFRLGLKLSQRALGEALGLGTGAVATHRVLRMEKRGIRADDVRDEGVRRRIERLRSRDTPVNR